MILNIFFKHFLRLHKCIFPDTCKVANLANGGCTFLRNIFFKYLDSQSQLLKSTGLTVKYSVFTQNCIVSRICLA